MIIGLIGNTSKENIGKILSEVTALLRNKGFDFLLCDELLQLNDFDKTAIETNRFMNVSKVAQYSDILFSIGGDGTLLSSSVYALKHDKPILGINFGKLGFLAEIDLATISESLDDIREAKYKIEERMVLQGAIQGESDFSMISINDIILDKGGWSKMITMSLFANGEFVTTMAADGLIFATPTGSTGYSLSAGGPIVQPGAEVITVSPICPHSLTVRPLVLPSSSIISVIVKNHPTEVQLNYDGQVSRELKTPLDFTVSKNHRSLKLVRLPKVKYFEILRSKLLWGLDVRSRD